MTTESSTVYRNRPADPKDETFDWYSDCGMADQDPTNLNNDKFTLTLSDGATRPPNILASPQTHENQTITQTSPTLPTFPHTQDINAEAALSSLSTTSDDTVTSQDTALVPPPLAHDATEPSMTPPTDSTPDPDGAVTSADSNQASKDPSPLPAPEAIPADTQQKMSRPTASTLDSDGAATTADSNQASTDLLQLPTLEAVPANTQQTGGKKKRRRRRKRPLNKDSIQSDSDDMEALGDTHQGRTYELENANDNISDLTQKLTNAETTTVTLNQELETGNTESANLKQQIETLLNEKASLIEELAKGKTEISALDEQLEDAKHKIVNDDFNKASEIGTWENKVEAERNKNTVLNNLLDKQRTEMRKEKPKLTHQEVQNNFLSNEVKGYQNENNRQKQEIEKLNSEKSGFSQELDKAKSEITNLKQEVKSLADQKSKLERATDTVADGKLSLKEQVSELESMNKRLEKERNKLQMELEREKDQQRGKDNEMETQYATIQEQKQLLESQNVDLKTASEDLVNKENAINHANEENTKLANEIEILEHRLRTQMGQVKGSEKHLRTTREELNTLKELHEKSIKELQSTVERLTMRVQAQPKTKLNEMKEEFAATIEANKRMEDEIETLRTEMSGLEAETRKFKKRGDMFQKRLSKLHGHTDEDDAEADEEKADIAREKAEIAREKAEIVEEKAKIAEQKAEIAREKAAATEEKAEAAGDKAATAGEKTEITGEKGATAEEKAAAAEHAGTAGKEADTAEEKIKTPHENHAEQEEAARDVPTVPTAEHLAETAEEKIKTPHENQAEQEEAAGDVPTAPTAEHVAVARNHEPAVTVIEEPRLPSAEVEAKGQELQSGLFGLTEAEIAKLMRANGNSSRTTEGETVMNAIALEKTEPSHKQIPQAGDLFTKAHASLKAPAELFDPDYDVSDSECSTTELSIDNQTPRASRRPLRQEGIHSRRHSTASNISVTKVEKWIHRIHRTSNYVEKHTQTESMVWAEDMDVQTENGPVKMPMVLVEDMGVQTEDVPVEMPMVLMEDMGVQTEDVPVEMPMVLMEDMGLQTEDVPVEMPMVLMEDMGVQTEDVPVKMPMVLMEDMGVQTEEVPLKMKEAAPNFRQTRGYLLMSSFIHLLMLLLYLGMGYIAWSTWAETTAERDLWTRTNSALNHGALLFENGSYPPSAISEIFYRKM